MRGKRYPDEFKIEAVKQVTERGYKIADVADRLGVTSKSLHNWINKFDKPEKQHITIDNQQDEIRKLKAELRRVTEERNILKEAAVDSIGQRNTHMKIWVCGGLLNETYIYNTRKRFCFRLMEARNRV